MKKLHEAFHASLSREQRIAELLGAINYIAALVIYEEEKRSTRSPSLRTYDEGTETSSTLDAIRDMPPLPGDEPAHPKSQWGTPVSPIAGY